VKAAKSGTASQDKRMGCDDEWQGIFCALYVSTTDLSYAIVSYKLFRTILTPENTATHIRAIR